MSSPQALGLISVVASVELAEAADPGDELLPICIPIQHVHDALLFDAM
jgi:hypothetical protein